MFMFTIVVSIIVVLVLSGAVVIYLFVSNLE